MPQFDLENLTLQKKNLLQKILNKKKRQEELRRELKQQHTLQDVKHIFVDAFDIKNVDEETPIIDQIVNIIYQVSAENFESNEN